MAVPDDTPFLARYPFLAKARELVQRGGYALGDLVADPAYDRARRRAVERVLGALERGGIPNRPTVGEVEAELELLSYPLARALVATVTDSYLTNRYAVAEAKLLHERLSHDAPEVVWTVATQIGLPLEPDPEAYARLHFLDYLRNAPARDPAWKLVNQRLAAGYVALTQDRVTRLAEEAFKDRLLEELDGLERPGRLLNEVFERDLNQIRTLVGAHRARFAADASGPIRLEAFPPCMKAIWGGIQKSVNIPHMGRFAIVSFLHTLGMSAEEILNFFATVPDFDVNKSRYQIEHITGQIGGSTQYSPPSCSTMQTYGICPLEQRDDICLKLIHHPLSYYRKKVRMLPPEKPSPSVAEVTDAPPKPA